jgi:Co/Zn/Cd efflux system component
MFVEILYGYITNSMSLLADGFHMGTHALALGLTYAAYILIRKFANSPLFPNGTEKIGVLAAYTSSLFLGITGIWIII